MEKAQLLITCKSLFNTLCDLYLSKTFLKRDVLSAKTLLVYWMLSSKWWMYIRNERGRRTEPCGTQDFIKSQEEISPLRATLWLRSRRRFKVLLLHFFALCVFNLNKSPSCHNLSKALEISKNMPLTFCVGSQSNEELILWIIDNDCEMQE